MPRFVVEVYLSAASGSESRDPVSGARRAARRLTSAGRPVRYLRSTWVPEDETCFHVFEAATESDVSAACQEAGIAAARILAAVERS